MKIGLVAKTAALCASLAAAGSICGGCASISEQTHPYLGSTQIAPTAPQSVRVLAVAPKEPVERLGEIILSVEGNPPREKLEARLRAGAARLGASGVYIASDQTQIQPVEYWGYWGPSADEYWHRIIIGIAFKDK
jgi:hypothetical protein